MTVDTNKPRINYEVFGKQVDEGEEEENDYEDEYDDDEGNMDSNFLR